MTSDTRQNLDGGNAPLAPASSPSAAGSSATPLSGAAPRNALNDKWRKVTIDQIKAPVKNAITIGPFGSRMKSDCYVPSGIPIIRGNNLTSGRGFGDDFVYITEEKAEELRNCMVFEGDLVFPHRGAIGEVGIVPYSKVPFVLSSSLMKLSCDRSQAHPLFLFYFFKSEIGRFELTKNASQVGTPGIGQPLASLRSIELNLPPPDIQESIAKILGDLDDMIELNRRINKSLEDMAQALFRSWFVDFDPVKAKIAANQEGRDPLRAAMCTISGKTASEIDAMPRTQFDHLAATAALFPDELEESELGEIPKGWKTGPLSNFCGLNDSSWTSKTLPKSVKYVDLANAKNGEIFDVQVLEGSAIPSRARRILKPGDTIVGTVRPGNRSFALVGESGLTGSIGFAVLHPQDTFAREFLYLSATSDENIGRLTRLADGGAYPAVRPELVVDNIQIAPNSNVLQAFHSAVENMFDRIVVCRAAGKLLGLTRDTLLPKLLSGELSVVEIPAEAD